MSAALFSSHRPPGQQCPLRDYNQHTSCLREVASSCAGRFRRSATSGNRLPHAGEPQGNSHHVWGTSGKWKLQSLRQASASGKQPPSVGHHWQTATSGKRQLHAFPPSPMCPTALQEISEISSISQSQRGFFFLSHVQSRTWCVLCQSGQTQGVPASPRLQGHHQASYRLAPQVTSLQLF